jgi:hypothetical protein
MASMARFLDDYDVGRKCGRYLAAELPSLPFEDQAFDLGLCSHFLFLYANQFSLEFHAESIVELCRVVKEVRIFPLLEQWNSVPEVGAEFVDPLCRTSAAGTKAACPFSRLPSIIGGNGKLGYSSKKRTKVS